MNKLFFISNSAHPCTEIALDANRIRAFYLANGWSETDDPSEADDLIVSTCAYNQQTEDAAIKDLTNRDHQLKSGARLITTGCLPKINPERLAETVSSEWVPPLQLDLFNELIDAGIHFRDVPCHAIRLQEYQANKLFHRLVHIKKKLLGANRRFGINLIPDWMATFPTTEWYFIRGATGCRGHCTYCAVRKAKGALHSASPGEIMKQVQEAIAAGAKEISLAGDDMGAWGTDIGMDLADLLKEILTVPGNFNVNIRFVEPLYLMKILDKITPIFATGRISAFCLPIQSGSNAVLKRMGRDYTIEEIEDLLRHLDSIPNRPKLASIIMVGFPGETEEDFQASASILDRLPIEFYQILAYEERPGTPSGKLPGQVPEEEKHRRQERLLRKFKLQKVVGLPSWLSSRLAGIPS